MSISKETNTSRKISRADKQLVLDVIWNLRRRLQFLDDTYTTDKILHGVYLVEKEIENLSVEKEEAKIHA